MKEHLRAYSEKIKEIKNRLIKMAREKVKHHHNPGEHIWHDLVEHIEPASKFNPDEKIIDRDIRVIASLEPDRFFEVMRLPADEQNTKPFFNYIEILKREAGLDISKGNSKYGYQMPLPENGKNYRELIIFRRNVKK